MKNFAINDRASGFFYTNNTDKTIANYPVYKILKKIENNKADYNLIQTFDDADLILAHFDSTQFQNLSQNIINYDPKKNQIIIVFSTSSLEKYEHTNFSKNNHSIYIFYVKNILVLDDVINEILSLNLEIAKQAIQDQSCFTLGWLNDPFFIHSFEYLTAIFILCETALLKADLPDKDWWFSTTFQGLNYNDLEEKLKSELVRMGRNDLNFIDLFVNSILSNQPCVDIIKETKEKIGDCLKMKFELHPI